VTLRQTGTPLDVLLDSLAAWADGTVQHDVAVALAQSGAGLVRDGFARSKTPDGQRWAPLKRPRPGGRVLVKTGRLLAAAPFYRVDRTGFVMDAVDRVTTYGGLHMTGTRTMPARPFYPQGQLSTGWSIVLADAADAAARIHIPR